jgi:hypothetical protein
MIGTLWFTANEIALVQAILPGVDLTRCENSWYYARHECTSEDPCRMHRVVQILLRACAG